MPKYWSYRKEYIENIDYDVFYDKMLALTKATFGTFMGKTYEVARRSCVFCDEETILKIKSGSKQFSYLDIGSYTWVKSSIIRKIKRQVEEFTGETYDYCLVNIYRNGTDYIPWHNDKEALNSGVVSVSLGQRRKFRLRKLSETTGFEKEFSLGQGDLLYMKPGCQANYKHCVPKELKITGSRINLTFRKLGG